MGYVTSLAEVNNQILEFPYGEADVPIEDKAEFWKCRDDIELVDYDTFEREGRNENIDEFIEEVKTDDIDVVVIDLKKKENVPKLSPAQTIEIILNPAEERFKPDLEIFIKRSSEGMNSDRINEL